MPTGSKRSGTPSTRLLSSASIPPTVADPLLRWPAMADVAFVTAQRQNSFFTEIIEAVRDELDQLGIPSSLVSGAFPELWEDRVYVLVPPHEWFALEGHRHPPSAAQLRRTVGICAE